MTRSIIAFGLLAAGWWVALHAGMAWQRSEHWSEVARLNAGAAILLIGGLAVVS